MPYFDSQTPSDFGWPVPPAGDFVDFTYRRHRFPQGVARLTVPVFTAALDLIADQPGYQLPASIGLDGGCWGQETRRKAGGADWSFHAYGLALDLAAPWNPSGHNVPAVSPYRLPANTDQLVRPLGILWGAEFGDWMHLEVHLSPQECSAGGGSSTSSTSFPLPRGYYYGPWSGPTQSISNQQSQHPTWVAGLVRAQVGLGIFADGLYGADTAAATRRWQTTHGLAVDGLIGPDTWASLGV